jgi:fatty-acyl-CoA synthase
LEKALGISDNAVTNVAHLDGPRLVRRPGPSLENDVRALAIDAGGRIAVEGSGESLDYAGLAELVDRIAGALLAAGAGGRVVALAMPPSPAYLAALLGTMAAGAAAAPLNTRLEPAEQAAYLARLEPSLLLASTDQVAALGAAGDWVAEVEEGIAAVDLPRRLQASLPKEGREVPADAALVFPTGGTTGTPKGALWSRGGAWLYAHQSALSQRRDRSDVELCYSPFFHVGVIVGPLATLAAGGRVVVQPSFDPAAALREIGEGRVTRLFGPPTMYSALRSEDAFARTPRDSVRGLMTGGASVTAEQLAALAREYPAAGFCSGYASTETGAVTFLSPEDVAAGRRDGVGAVLPGVTVRILDAAGNPLPAGEDGRVVVRTPWQASGYLGLEQETRGTWTAAGVDVGDIGRLDAGGRLTISGRAREMIKTGGENVYPAEVEAALARCPEVEFVTVYGVDDEHWGERVEAAVSPRRGQFVDADRLREACRGIIAAYKLPKQVRIVERIPVTAAGKPDRRRLRRDAMEERC